MAVFLHATASVAVGGNSTISLKLTPNSSSFHAQIDPAEDLEILKRLKVTPEAKALQQGLEVNSRTVLGALDSLAVTLAQKKLPVISNSFWFEVTTGQLRFVTDRDERGACEIFGELNGIEIDDQAIVKKIESFEGTRYAYSTFAGRQIALCVSLTDAARSQGTVETFMQLAKFYDS
jgi:hypothetical protein